MKIYMIDDNKDKVAHLDQFLLWIHSQFPAYSFESGFTDPISASYDATQIKAALEDQDGIILLDLFMEDIDFVNAANSLLCAGHRCETRRNHIWDKLQHVAHKEEVTKLAATVVALAEHNGARLAWASSDPRVTDILAQFSRLKNPEVKWSQQVAPPSWDDDDANELRPLIENFREPYLNAANAWREMSSSLHCETFQFPGNIKPTNKLFPDDGSNGHNPTEHLNHPSWLAANRAATQRSVEKFLEHLKIELPTSPLKNDDLLYFLKFASRSKQLHLKILPLLFGGNVSMSNIDIHDGIGCESCSPGSLVLAINIILSEDPLYPTPTVLFKKTNGHIEMQIDYQNAEPKAARETLSMKPGERMAGPPRRDTPGENVLALDYIRPDLLEEIANGVRVTKSFTKAYVI